MKRFKIFGLLALIGMLSGCYAFSPPQQEPRLKPHVLRLKPGDDLKKSLESYLQEHQLKAAVVLTCVGSLQQASLRFANQPAAAELKGPFEIVSLVGMLSTEGVHLHLSIADNQGITKGGHLTEGNLIYTTAEIALAELPGYRFAREHDPLSGYKELKIYSPSP